MILSQQTTKRFNINRGVRQGCPASPFLFLVVVELLSLSCLNEASFKGITIFDREIKISQLADDTTLFLQDESQVSHAVNSIRQFSEASGLCLNLSKCELLPLFNCDKTALEGIPVKDSVKYLGVHITKDPLTRQKLNFHTRLKKTKSTLNNWLQRDVSIFGRALLSKAGLSRLVYPSLSLFINDATCKDVNKVFFDFIWKNKTHRLKKICSC